MKDFKKKDDQISGKQTLGLGLKKQTIKTESQNILDPLLNLGFKNTDLGQLNIFTYYSTPRFNYAYLS